MRHGNGGKGDDRRPGTGYQDGHDRIDWSKKLTPTPPPVQEPQKGDTPANQQSSYPFEACLADY